MNGTGFVLYAGVEVRAASVRRASPAAAACLLFFKTNIFNTILLKTEGASGFEYGSFVFRVVSRAVGY